jgi:hypothetical protein
VKLTFVGWECVSGNRFHKQHWRVYSAYKKKVCLPKIQDAFFVCGEPHGDRKFKVKFTCYRKRLLDDDNLRGGLKPVRDCLILAGFLKDDSPKWGVFEYEQFVLSQSPFDKRPTLIIEITPLTLD